MKKPTVFISYSHTDSKFVNELADKLKVSGVDVWIDKWKIKVGDSITGKINEGIGSSDFLIVVLSRTSVASKWVQEEINTALIRNIEQDKHAYILPVLKEDCIIPTLLEHRKFANFKDDPEQGFQELIEVISPYKDFEPEMIRIPAGEFLMGSNPKADKDAVESEQPQLRVDISEYSIGKFPITNMQYKDFVGPADYKSRDPIYFEHREQNPVINVSWHDAMDYCNWMAGMTGKPYRLPTEAEWEKAARGTDGRIYPWGNVWDKTNCNLHEEDSDGTTPVGLYSPQGDSPYGCADMAGNVWEWCSSLFKDYPYRANDGREDLATPESRAPVTVNTHITFMSSQKDLATPGSRVLRGGGFLGSPFLVRCAARYGYDPDDRYGDIGFRVVVSLSDSDI